MIATFIHTLLVFMQFGLNPAELYSRGNAYYGQGKYSEAIAAYEQISRQFDNASVHYNLGNSYFKSGMIGKAILNFRRANYLSPRDGDIAYNLNYARNYRVDKVHSDQSPLVDLMTGVVHYVSLYEAQILTTAFFVVAVFFLSISLIYRRRISAYLLVGSAVPFLFFLICWLSWGAEVESTHAVVVAPEVSATSGPGKEYKEILLVHDGAEVIVRETRSGYALIQLPGGVGGWVQVGALEFIF
jgi:tetratricopeptide (TPR) repeat protein